MILPQITHKQKEILTLFPKFRFLTRLHIQHLLHHKDKRRINTWLKDLHDKKYIEKITGEKREFAPRKYWTYHLGKIGIKFIKTYDRSLNPFLNNMYRDYERSHTFVSLCLHIADIVIDLEHNTKSDEKFLFQTRCDYATYESAFHSLMLLHPHLSFTKHKKRKTEWYILEIFSSFLPTAEIRKRIHAYARFLADEQWSGNSPIVLFICASKETSQYVKHYTKNKIKKFDIEDVDMRYAVEKDVKALGVRGEIWEKI